MSPWVKKYVFARMFGASDKRARKGIEMLGFDRRKTGRIIRVGRRAYARVHATGLGYRSFDEQRRLYERWRDSGRGVVAAPVTDFQSGSHHSRGVAIDVGPSYPDLRLQLDHAIPARGIDLTAYAYIYMPINDGRHLVSIGPQP